MRGIWQYLKACRHLIVLAVFALPIYSCADLTDIEMEMSSLNSRVDELEMKVQQMRDKIADISTVADAYATGDVVTEVSPVYNDPDNPESGFSGYYIVFRNHKPVFVQSKGEDGEDGKDGVDGKPGTDGEDGKDGIDGLPGTDGEDGEDGEDGQPGAQGPAGEPGADGEDGKPGVISFIKIGTEYYWKFNGEIVIVDGKWLAVDQAAGYTPRLREGENGNWEVSFDKGESWEEFNPYVSDVTGLTDVKPKADKVDFYFGETVITVPYQQETVSLILEYENNIPVPAACTVSIKFTLEGNADAEVSVYTNKYMGPCSIVNYPEHGYGYVKAYITDQYEVEKQKAYVVLKTENGTRTRELTFVRGGSLDVDPIDPVSKYGGEVSVTVHTSYNSFSQYLASANGASVKSTSGTTTIYEMTENTGSSARISTVELSATDGNLKFTRTLSLVQLGQEPCYEEYLGSWTMSGTEKYSSSTFSSTVTINRDPDVEYGYLIYGLSPGSGVAVPVKARYDIVGGKMLMTLPQKGLDDYGTAMYPFNWVSGALSEQKEFVFTSDGDDNSMTTTMTSDFSFMYMTDGEVVSSDRVFYYNATLRRSETPSYSDGQVVRLNVATAGYKPLNVVIFGDGYQAKDNKVNGKFERNARNAMDALFSVEPFASFKNRFDVYMVVSESTDAGCYRESEGSEKSTAFSSRWTDTNGNTLITADWGKAVEMVGSKVGLSASDGSLYRTISIILVNVDGAAGTCNTLMGKGTCSTSLVGDGIASTPVCALAVPSYGFSGLVQHEAGGHAFGRLADEYYNSIEIYPTANHAGLKANQEAGYYRNVSISNDSSAPWYSVFNGRSAYNGLVGFHSGALNYSSGIYRSASTSIMITNTGTFNAVSRELIYKRIILQSEGAGTYSTDRFFTYDQKNL